MEPEDLTEKQLTSRSVYEGRLLHVKEDCVALPDGKETTREYIVHPGAVAVIASLGDGTVLMERQFRYPLRRDLYELPAGKLDPNESPLGCGQRELLEETGYVARSWKFVATIHPCIGYSDEVIYLYLAEDLTLDRHNRDGDEFLEIFSLPLDEALEWVRCGRITDVKTVIGLFWADKMRQGWEPPSGPDPGVAAGRNEVRR